MQILRRTLLAALATAFISIPAYAGECCAKAAAAAKDGKACATCTEKQCCKDAIAKVKDAKACEVCAAKKKSS